MFIEKQKLDFILEKMQCGRLGVLSEDGTIDLMPVVFAKVKESIFTPIDEKPKRRGRVTRLDSIKMSPSVTLLLDHYSSSWADLWWIKLKGNACEIDERSCKFPAAVAALKQKYGQYNNIGVVQKTHPTLIEIQYTEIKVWAYSGAAGFDNWIGDQ